MKTTRPSVCVELSGDLIVHIIADHGVAGWNSWLAGVRKTKVFSQDKGIPAFLLDLCVKDVDLSGRKLGGIDLKECLVENVDFSGSDLRGAMFGVVENSSFRGANLTGTEFFSVSGCDFTGAAVDGVDFNGVCFGTNCPPVGLRDEVLSACIALPAKAPKPRSSARYKVQPLMVSATLAALPSGQ